MTVTAMYTTEAFRKIVIADVLRVCDSGKKSVSAVAPSDEVPLQR